MNIKYITALFALLALVTNTTQAQDTIPTNKWHFIAEPYLLSPNMKGQTQLGQLPAIDVNANPSDIFGNLEMGGMIYLEATNNNWSATTDIVYMELGSDIDTKSDRSSGDISCSQLFWEMAALKKVAPYVEVGVGARFVSIGAEVEYTSPLSKEYEGETTESWVDPLLVVRSQSVFKERWIAQFRGDIGGFGIGSKFSWQTQAYVGYKFCKWFQTSVGYRAIGIDYQEGEGRENFVYDIDTYGWVVRAGFTF